VVADGFSGNILLKSIEGTAMFMGSLMKHKIFMRNTLSKIGYLFCKKGVKEVVDMMDYRQVGGTQFLGIRQPVIKIHGSSDELAFYGGIKQAMDAANHNITQDLEEYLAKIKGNSDD
jgi:glycerol-3-phosphate acyltransferase PlsX